VRTYLPKFWAIYLPQLTMTTIKIAPVKPTISIDVLEKIDIRVGTIELGLIVGATLFVAISLVRHHNTRKD